ncbi:MAG: hypothetical protein LT105_08200, partial [Lentimicrobium sp.]|nr:hypothetical protein [Lentimicrobium sp.]
MYTREVNDKHLAKVFLQVGKDLYKNDPNWICPLDNMIEAVFDPSRNVFFTHGEATRWVLFDSSDKPIGRVAAFINRKKA